MDMPISVNGEITAQITDHAVRFQSKIENQALSQWGFTKNDVEDALKELQTYRSTGLTPEEISNLGADVKGLRFNLELWQDTAKSLKDELQAYKDAEEQGLMIKRRIKPLDKVYHIVGTVQPGGKFIKEVKESVIYSIAEYAGGVLNGTRYESYDEWNFYEEDISVKAFLAREEAEEALKGGIL